MPLTKTQQALLEEMKAALRDGVWESVPAPHGLFTIRYTETLPTPARIPERWWGAETYTRHHFLTLGPRGVVHGDARSPWVERVDRHVTYKRAFEILRDPPA